MVRRAVLVPAALHRSAGLVARDLLHEATLRRARARHDEAPADERWFDDGRSGQTAAQVARRVAAFAPDEVELLVAGTHARAGEVLAAALRQVTAHVAVTFVDTDGDYLPDPAQVPLSPDPAWLATRRDAAPWALPPRTPRSLDLGRASPLPPALHAADASWLARLCRWITEHRPHALAEWRCLLHAHDAGVDPVEAVYAGMHLRDRNADLLVNIL